MYPELVTIDSQGQMTGSVMDFCEHTFPNDGVKRKSRLTEDSQLGAPRDVHDVEGF